MNSMKTINASSTMSQEKMTTWNTNWMLCMLHEFKGMQQCSTLMCDFVACRSYIVAFVWLDLYS